MPSPAPSSMNPGRHDRRTSSRKDLDILINRFVDGYPYMCKAVDVSPTGMRVRPIHEPHMQDAELGRRFMGLQFQLPGGNEVLTASGEAVFKDSRRGEIGIRFTSLSKDSREAIARFLARN